MPTFISHAVVGLSAGACITKKPLPKRFWILSAICPVIPDFDVTAFAVGIPYDAFFGHRGFFHSILFAAILAFVVVAIFFKKHQVEGKSRFGMFVYFFLICASHGVLDAFTSGGLGVALLAPVDNSRIFFAWTPIQVSPIGIRRFFSVWGLMVLGSEMIWVWSPCIITSLIVRYRKSKNIRQL
jgi:inner membrane protein